MGTLSRRSAMVLLAGLAALGASPATALAAADAGAPAPMQLTAEAGAANAKFGTSVWIEGNTAVVGAPDEGGMGAAYVFTRRAGVWSEEATLVAPVRTEGGKFGYDVGLSGDTIVVGAPNSDQTPIPEAGAAHVFVRTPGGWAHRAELSASDARADDAFGFGVAISGDTVVVGAHGGNQLPGVEAASGAAYVFSRIAGAWGEQAKLTPADGGFDDGFGYSVVVSGDTAVVGTPGDDVGAAIDQGSARVFTRNGTTWTEQATLTAPDLSPVDGLGESVSISGDTVVVGAPVGLTGTNPAHGSAYVFTRRGEGWAQEAQLTAPDGAPADQFGRSVAVTGDTIAVGAHFSHVADGRHGAVYIFERLDDRWAEPTKLIADGSELLGVSVAMSAHTVIGGANFTDVDGRADRGAAYVFDLRPRPSGVQGAGAASSEAGGGSEAGGHPRVLGQSQAAGTLPVTGGETRTLSFVALTALGLGWLLVRSGRAARADDA
jgi:hypothetical protein